MLNVNKVNPDYKRIFTRERGSFAFQNIGGGWRTSKKPLGDGLIIKHLNGELWIATRAGWYIEAGLNDLDTHDIGILEDVCNFFRFDYKNSLIEQSPNKGFHIIFKPRFNDKVPAQKLYFDVLVKYEEYLKREMGLPQLELFPKSNVAIRAPLGRDQIFIDPDTLEPFVLTQEQLIHYFEKLNPIDLRDISPQLLLPFEFKNTKQIDLLYDDSTTGKELYLCGPQVGISRYRTTWLVILYLFRKDGPAYVELCRKIYRYIQKHQIWFLENSRHGHQAYQRALAQIRYLERNEDRYTGYPDALNNSEFHFTKSDLVWILKNFKGKNEQRAVFNMVRYYSPRAKTIGPWVSIHRDRWVEWLSWRTYKKFQQMLESRNILEIRDDYIIGKQSKCYKLNLPSQDSAILHDGRQIRNFEAALVKVFTDRELYELTGDYTKVRRIKETAKQQVIILNPEDDGLCRSQIEKFY